MLPYVPKSKIRFSETGFSLADTEYKHTVHLAWTLDEQTNVEKV
jgi:hypothetical protein